MKFKLVTAAGLAVLAAAAALLAGAAGVFNPDGQPVGYVGQPAVSSANVATGEARMYSIDYSARNWTGNVHAYPVSAAGAVGTVDEWGTGGAAAKIRAQAAADTRYIVTIRDGAGIPFRWADLSQGAGGQREALDAASVGASSSALLDYIRGSNANEGTAAGQFRSRAGVLGDIIHSTPAYWNDGVNETVFIGANDGMLHALNAQDGSERFAYVPQVLLPKLAMLANQGYSHKYYVDGRMDVRKMGAQTILAGTLGGGGKAMFALDVTNANATSEANAAAKVLWEVTNESAGFADLGDTYGAPTLATLPDGTHALVIGNGYNNTGSGHAVLYLVNARTGALIRAMDTGEGSEDAPNGLSSPSLWDLNGDGRKDTAYAGDINGNLWKFSLAAPYTAPARVLHTNNQGAGQAITMAPGLMRHPLGGVMVAFVTGRMLAREDAADTSSNYAYGIWDGKPSSNTALLEQTLTEASYVGGGNATRVRIATRNAPNWRAGGHAGWRVRLPVGGERVVGDGAFVTGDIFQFFSTNPAIAASSIPPGENWWMQLNALTGGDAGATLFDLDGDNQFTSGDKVGDDDPVGRYMGGGVRSQLISLSADGVDVYQSNYDRNSAPAAETVNTTTTTVDGQRGVSGGHFDTDFICYRNCGAATSLYRTIYAGGGVYSVGRENGGDTDGLNYVHVHEYDDIYDRIGIDTLRPSQDFQRVHRARASAVITHAPNTPNFEDREAFPAAGVTLVSTSTDTGMSARSVPRASYNYQHTVPVPLEGFPASESDDNAARKISKTRYTTTLAIGEAVDVGARRNNRYPYSWRTTVRKWDTVITTVETVPNFRFKVLVSNQAYSPAVTLRIGGAENASAANAAYDGPVFNFQTTAGLTAASLASYRIGSVRDLELAMPLDAFNIKNWGTGVTRTGLHPIRPQCAGVAVERPTPGPLGEWRNGALTVQVVDASVTDAEIQMNVSGRPELGYRLKPGALKAKLVAEYLIYWHHPNNKCMADTGWTKTPPQDDGESDALPGVWAPGEDDPRGVFRAGSGESASVVPPPPPTTTVTNPDGSTTITTVVHTALAGGGYTVTTTVRTIPPQLSGSSGIVTGGAVGSGGEIDTGGINKSAANLGRINWRELQR
ncbi:pilus assembly protein [Massilia sp. GCM10020059]|uniref:PilY1 beta-propeller domain-containing protein n=1 Tax=Massilia agrisoli TaxID=2892444 RepID=A0ABS8IWR6_9BURK|nr:PilC/PilY family type IV pilus protein [Massilia agrisoli]MCC6072118.1 hypothetical protein [Massilia agrisoli]